MWCRVNCATLHHNICLPFELFEDWWWLLSPRAGLRNCPKKRLSKRTDMTIHWKVLKRTGTFSFPIQPFLGEKIHFLNFSQKISVLKELTQSINQIILCHITSVTMISHVTLLVLTIWQSLQTQVILENNTLIIFVLFHAELKFQSKTSQW
jgi:hypothetical protein